MGRRAIGTRTAYDAQSLELKAANKARGRMQGLELDTGVPVLGGRHAPRPPEGGRGSRRGRQRGKLAALRRRSPWRQGRARSWKEAMSAVAARDDMAGGRSLRHEEFAHARRSGRRPLPAALALRACGPQTRYSQRYGNAAGARATGGCSTREDGVTGFLLKKRARRALIAAVRARSRPMRIRRAGRRRPRAADGARFSGRPPVRRSESRYIAAQPRSAA